jgi:hypothetical protein
MIGSVDCRRLLLPLACTVTDVKSRGVLRGHSAVKLCYQLQPSQVDPNCTKFSVMSTVRKRERRRL